MMTYDPKKWLSYTDDLQCQNDIEKNEFDVEDSTSESSYIPTPSFYDQNSLIYQDDVDQNVEYDPCAPAINVCQPSLKCPKEVPDPRKLEFYISMLQKMIRPLSPDFKKKLPYDVICQLAHSVLDGTVFEIVKGLQDIQLITEKNLFSKRATIVTDHKTKRSSMSKRHQESIQRSQSRPHHIVVLEKHHSEEIKMFHQKCEKELTKLDQKLVLDMDQVVADQQATLQRAGLPMFYITNDPGEVKLQMYVLDFVSRLINS